VTIIVKEFPGAIMGSWIDKWAKKTATTSTTQTAAPSDVATSAEPVEPPSRRDFLKKAGIVGGAAWSIPVMQTVLAPMASASTNTPLGGACNDLDPCANGAAYCNGSVCGGKGAVCTGLCAVSTCANGQCGGGGGSCYNNSQCVSHICKTGKCRAKLGAACTKPGNCFSGRCSGGVCVRASAGGGCLNDAGCKTGRCNTTSKTCRQAVRGGGCWVDTDCAKPGNRNINCSKSGSSEPFVCGGKGAVCSNSADCDSTASGNRCPNGHCKA
jgi:hypothetical protein